MAMRVVGRRRRGLSGEDPLSMPARRGHAPASAGERQSNLRRLVVKSMREGSMKAQSSFRLPLATLAAGLIGTGVVAAAMLLLGQEPDAAAASREARAAQPLPMTGST